MYIRAFGKVNLYLDVLNKRSDGYHNILTLFQSVQAYDDIFVEFSETEFFESNPDLQIPWDKNILKKTIDIFKKETGITNFNLNIKLIKRLPIGGGVAGGSADAAAVLSFLTKEFNILESDTVKIAEKIGSDVPFLLKGGTAIGKGRGEILEFLQPLKINIELFPMSISIDTKKAYEKLDKNWENIIHKGDPYVLYKALKENNIKVARENAFNVFEQLVFKDYPELKRKKVLTSQKQGTIFSLMTGSGSTIFRVY